MDCLAIVIVTFKRQELLGRLFDSIAELTVAPWRVVVVDNENSPKTARMVADFSARLWRSGARRALSLILRVEPLVWSMTRRRPTPAALVASQRA